MIEEISIRNLGVIADAVLPLGPGFTAVTGETGAGKTMVVSALGLLLGERADTAAVRQGSAQTWVEGRWRVEDDGEVASRVREAGGDLDPLGVDGAGPDGAGPDGAGADTVGTHGAAELVLSRSVSSEGRSRAIIGGRGAPISVLAELAEKLVVVHGQSDQVRLRSATAQREALDRFAGPDFGAQLARYREIYLRWRANAEQLDELVGERDRRQAEAERLREALAEIEAADPQPGEDDELSERAERLTNLEQLREGAAGAREQLSAEISDAPDAMVLIDSARRAVERVAEHDVTLAPIASSLADAGYLVAEVAAELSSYLAGLDTDGARELETVQERRAELTVLTRKYGPSLAEVIDRLGSGSARLSELDGDGERIEQLAAGVEADRLLLEEAAGDLSAGRASAGERLGEAVSAELGALAMPDARITVEVTSREELTASGRDQVSILLRPHPGAPPRALARGASGGELSRVMLALEVVLAGSDPVPTFVFDEIDAGVGGAAAIEIGRRLGRLAENAQVIAVTHLAQVAAFATNHLSVVKDSDGAVTASSVRALAGAERVAEMTRLLSGLADSESGLQHARELLELAGTGAATD